MFTDVHVLIYRSFFCMALVILGKSSCFLIRLGIIGVKNKLTVLLLDLFVIVSNLTGTDGQRHLKALEYLMWNTSVHMRKWSWCVCRATYDFNTFSTLTCSPTLINSCKHVWTCSPTMPVSLNMRMSMPSWWGPPNDFFIIILYLFLKRFRVPEC